MKQGGDATRRKRRSSEEVADRLLIAAEREFRRSGYAGATTAAIAREADTTEAQLFRSFGSKAALFREAIFKPLDRHFADFNARHLVDDNPEQRLQETARLYITELQHFLSEHADMLLALLAAQTYAPDRTDGVENIDSLTSYFQRGAARMAATTGDRLGVDSRLLVRVSFAAVLGNVIFRDRIYPEGLATEQEIGDAILDFILHGIGPEINAREPLGKSAPRRSSVWRARRQARKQRQIP